MKKWLTSLLCLTCLSVCDAEEIKNAETGTTFPSTVTFEHEGKPYQLDATGTSTRKRMSFKVYGMASHTPSPFYMSVLGEISCFLKRGQMFRLLLRIMLIKTNLEERQLPGFESINFQTVKEDLMQQ